jgi:hypothetical protein
MAAIAENQATISPVPVNRAPIASMDRRPGRRRVAAAAIAGYAFDLRDGKELDGKELV